MENKKIKILIYGMTKIRGGLELYLYNFARYCDYERFSLSFLDTQFDGIIFQEELKKLGCNIIKLTPSNIDYNSCVYELKKILKEQKYDYIYTNVTSYSRFHFLIQKFKPLRTKIVIHSHGIVEHEKLPINAKISHYLGKLFFLNKPILRVACGNEAGKSMFGQKEFDIFSNGIDVEKFKYNANYRDEIRKEFCIKDTDLLFGHIARLSTEKNHSFLIEIFAEILKYKPNSKLILVGDGQERINIEKKINELKIASNVIFAGVRDDAYKFYSALDTFVMPSIKEGFGISIIEAQANGLFCFGSENLDKSTNLTGNVKYISLEKSAKEWAEIILENMKRDSNVLDKFSEDFKAEESYRKIFNYFKENI